MLEILQRHVIAFLRSGHYWNKAAPTSFQGRRFVMFHDACATSSDWYTIHVLLNRLNEWPTQV